MNLGRNDPCLCGSGKKYKHCCLFEVETSGAKQRRYGMIEENLASRLLEYAFNTFGTSSFQDAWKEFNDVDEIEGLETGHPISVLFIPWYLYYWKVESNSDSVETTIAKSFQADHGEELTKEEVEFLNAASGAPYSLHQIINVKPGISISLRDLFTAAERDVLESDASLVLQPGEIIYCALTEFDKHHLMVGCGPFELQSAVVDEVLKLRDLIVGAVGRENLGDNDLVEAAHDIRVLYLNLVDDTLAAALGTHLEMVSDEADQTLTDSEERHAVILEIVDNQISGGNPPETKQTLERLMKDGYSMEGAKELIAHVVAAEVFNILTERQPFNVSRFVEGLHALPEIPE